MPTRTVAPTPDFSRKFESIPDNGRDFSGLAEIDLVVAEEAAFTSDGFLRWLNRVRPKGKPELTQVPLTAEGMAKTLEEAFREHVHLYGG